MKQRFLDKTMPEPNTGCWIWIAAHNPERGYGYFRFNGRLGYAHRASWEIFHGEIPDGLFVCHKCDNPWCVNPDHLFLGSQRENMVDCARKNRLHRRCFSNDEIRTIKARLVSGESAHSIAKSLGVRKQRIYEIKLGQKYAWIDLVSGPWFPHMRESEEPYFEEWRQEAKRIGVWK